MKYSATNQPVQCMMTNSTCYKGTKTMTPKGVLWHSTGANNTNIKRYVQPSSNDANYQKLMSLIGRNTNGNDWNHTSVQAGLNAWIGTFSDGSIGSVQTMPWNYRPWGCGGGTKGSCNDGWIQFEICEDSLTNKQYFEAVYKEACELTAYLLQLYKLDPKGTTVLNGVTVPVILCHADSCKLGLGSNHGDIYHWFSKYGKTMDDVRNDVAALMKAPTSIKPIVEEKAAAPAVECKVGDAVQLKANAIYLNGYRIPDWVIKSTTYVREIRKNGDIVFSVLKTGSITGVINPSMIEKNLTTPQQETVSQKSFLVKVTANSLNIRKGPGTNYAIVGHIKDKGIYTIIETQGIWGKLKSGAGWISLDYVTKK